MGNGETTATKPANHLIAALCYLGFVVTGVVFLYIEPYDKDEFVRFHARQSIAFSIAWFAVNIVIGVAMAVLHPLMGLLSLVQSLINLGFFIVWLLLMWQAYNGQKYRLPMLADWVDSMGF
jgi:uncharacterized membrane protein